MKDDNGMSDGLVDHCHGCASLLLHFKTTPDDWNTFTLEKNGRHNFAEEIFKHIFFVDQFCIFIVLLQKFISFKPSVGNNEILRLNICSILHIACRRFICSWCCFGHAIRWSIYPYLLRCSESREHSIDSGSDNEVIMIDTFTGVKHNRAQQKLNDLQKSGAHHIYFTIYFIFICLVTQKLGKFHIMMGDLPSGWLFQAIHHRELITILIEALFL